MPPLAPVPRLWRALECLLLKRALIECHASELPRRMFADHVFKKLLVLRGAIVDTQLFHAHAVLCADTPAGIPVCNQFAAAIGEQGYVIERRNMARNTVNQEVGLAAVAISQHRQAAAVLLPPVWNV